MKIKNNFKFTTFIIIFGFVVLELILFLLGRCLLWQRRAEEHKDAEIRIVCVGDSHTFGVGTAARYAYPKQLEQLLNINNPTQRFSVVNLGVPGASTKHQAQELGAFIQRYDAQLVILLTGRNNANEVERWADSVVRNRIISRLDSLRSPKFLTALFDRLVKGNTQQRDDYLFQHGQRYTDYLIFYLEQVRRLCREKGVKLILLSYYNSSDDIIKDFARSRSIPYFDFTVYFNSLFSRDKRTRYISPDMSHMNHRGYKFFAEQLYNYLFLNQRFLGLTIYPALQRIDDAVFYSNGQEVQQVIKVQEARIERSRNSETYAFELIHLGHIYSEIGDDASAYKYYRKGLIAANYIDNNTIVSPIINWYLKKGQRDAALKICEEILEHNPANSIAQVYRTDLLAHPDGVVGNRTIH